MAVVSFIFIRGKKKFFACHKVCFYYVVGRGYHDRARSERTENALVKARHMWRRANHTLAIRHYLKQPGRGARRLKPNIAARNILIQRPI